MLMSERPGTNVLPAGTNVSFACWIPSASTRAPAPVASWLPSAPKATSACHRLIWSCNPGTSPFDGVSVNCCRSLVTAAPKGPNWSCAPRFK